MIGVTALSMHYSGRLLFDEVNLNLLKGNRYGLVGANGAGKSTFLRLLANTETPSLGEILLPKAACIGWLKQDQFRYEDNTLIEVVIQGKPKLWQALQEKEQLLSKDSFDEKAAHKLAHLEETIANLDGYSADSFARRLLLGLGVPSSQHDLAMNKLSGGYKLRVLLAQSLFEEPDILLLDEPTNHLDITSISWLENYLKTEFKGLLIYISHDQDFLNNLSTHILDVDYGEITEYVGNYDRFMKEKELVLEQKLKEKSNLDKKIQKMKTFIERFRASAARSKQAQSREKLLEKIELPEIKNTSRVAPKFRFQQARPSGKTVLKVKNIIKSYGPKKVLHNISFDIQKGERVGLIGPNGIGKSTLLKIINAQIAEFEGQYEWGYETRLSYFAQDHHETLKGKQPLIEWLSDQLSGVPSADIRRALGQMLFSHDDVYKTINILSGGEAARALIAKMMLEKNNILILDEPTNHLDLETRLALAEALTHFTGTVLFVSHDRHFVDQVSTRILVLSEGGIQDFSGNYSEYLNKFGLDYLLRSTSRN